MSLRASSRNACLVALLLGCDALPPVDPLAHRADPTVGATPASVTSALAKPRSTLRRATGEVAVRLGTHESAQRLDVAGAEPASVRIERDSAGKLRVAGRERAEIELKTRAGEPWLKLGERCYMGRLRIRARAGGFEITNLVDLEHYVAGVVAAEVGVWSAEPEELRAQAIAARSYAVAALDDRARKTREPYLFDDVRDQAYLGVLAKESRALRQKLANAIATTRGVVLLEGDSVVDARFHAACGGNTAGGRDVFPEAVHASLRSAVCMPCGLASDVAWSWNAPRELLDRLASRWRIGDGIVRIDRERSDGAARWLAVTVVGDSGSRTMPFEELRRALGPDKLQSSRITRVSSDGGIAFEGRGRGHGVGLCQQGARGYAKRGWSAERILEHYYTGATCAEFRE